MTRRTDLFSDADDPEGTGPATRAFPPVGGTTEDLDYDGPEPEAEDEEWLAQPRRFHPGRWLLVIALVTGGLAYGVHRFATQNFAEQIARVFPDASLLPADPVKVTKSELQLQMYYPAHNLSLAPYRLKLQHDAGLNERLTLIARALETTPPGNLLDSPLPAGGKVLGIYLLDKVAWVDLGQEFLKPAGATPQQERLIVYSIVNSIQLNLPSVTGVRFMIGGQPLTSAWGWLDLSTPLGPDLSLIR